MKNQMDKKMENEMDTWIIQGIIGVRVLSRVYLFFSELCEDNIEFIGKIVHMPSYRFRSSGLGLRV